MTTKGRSGQTDKTMWKTEQKVKTYVEKFHMIEPGDTIVLGISGGADSVCLLKILSKWKESWGISLKAVHVHHQLRGKEADDDEAFVRRLCEGEGIGRVGFLKHDMSVKELCSMVKEQFSLDKVALYGNEDEIVKKVAICPGSGKDEIELALLKGAKAIRTGDGSYHYGIDSVAKGINVIDAGHYGIEHIFIDKIYSYLIENTKDIEVVKMDLDNPQKYI